MDDNPFLVEKQNAQGNLCECCDALDEGGFRFSLPAFL